ncbi:MAG: DEAD/DEAH box helicase [Candidatus Zixiibacteriota bacterium]
MMIKDLVRYEIPEQVLEVWQDVLGPRLLPVQSKAIRRGILGENFRDDRPLDNMIISAPTGSGKSFCAELAVARTLMSRRRSVMLCPLKSLAEQKHKQFQATFGRLGVRCIIATGDHPENDQALARGDYQIAVAIYEKFDLLLAHSLDALGNIGLVVVDEIQTISDPGRGAILERLLTRIRASVYTPRIIALSAVLGEHGKSVTALAEWLQAVVIEETTRPVDLLRGVAADGSYRYRSFNSGLDGSDIFARESSADDQFDSFVEQIRSEPGSAMVFLKSRLATVDRAMRLASRVNWEPATEAMDALSDEEPSFLNRTLRQLLSRGVAFHNSDLSASQRRIVEEAFASRKVKVLFSTTTLAMGVNLSADTVYLETVKYAGPNYDGRPSLVPVTRAEFDNMTGRAGRLSSVAEARPGRAVVMAGNNFEREILWQTYISSERDEPLVSSFDSLPLEDWVLHMITSGLAHDESSLVRVCKCTLWAGLGNPVPVEKIRAATERLLALNYLRSDENSVLSVSPVGRGVACSGLAVSDGSFYLSRVGVSGLSSDTEWLALVLGRPGWTPPPLFLTHHERKSAAPLRMVVSNGECSRLALAMIVPDSERAETPSYRSLAALKGILLFADWQSGMGAQELEEKYQVHVGQIMSMADEAAHQVSALCTLMAAMDRNTPHAVPLSALASSLKSGLPTKARELHELCDGALTRGDIMALLAEGIDSVDAFASLTPERINHFFSSERKRKQLTQLHTDLLKEDCMRPFATAEQPLSSVRAAIPALPDTLEIDGSFERDRFLVKINGMPVRLTAKSFKYLTKLAHARLASSQGWLYKDDIEIGFNQARYLYRMKGELHGDIASSWQVFENNRLGYYRLALDPMRVRVNYANLRNHHDFEIRKIAESGAGPTVN